MGREILTPNQESQAENNVVYLVTITPDLSEDHRILKYKEILESIGGGKFLLDDTTSEIDRYWDRNDRHCPPREDPGIYRIRASLRNNHSGKSINDVWSSLENHETPLTLLEGLYMLQQHPSVMKSLEESPIIFPGTEAIFGQARRWYPCVKKGEEGLFVDLITPDYSEPNLRAATRQIRAY